MKSSTIVTIVLSIAVSFISVIVSAQAPDTLWTRTYGGNDIDAGDCVRQTMDGGYIISGSSHPNQSQVKMFLIKTDENGDEVWSNNYWPSSGNDDADCIVQTPEGDYICTGHTSLGDGLYDIHWMKVDADGDVVWMYNYGSIYPDEGYCIQATLDGNYVITGYNRFRSSSSNDATLIKIDPDGNIIWERNFIGSRHEVAMSVFSTLDGGYILSGYTESYSVGGTDFYLIRTDENGDSLWSRTYGGVGNEEMPDIQQTPDGGYIAVGFTKSTPGGDYDIYVVRTDSNGDSLWTRAFGGPGDERGYGVQFTQLGTEIEYIIVGHTSSEGAGGYDAYIIKVDDEGNEIWHKTIGGPDDDHANHVLQNSNGNYIICGETGSFGTGGGKNVWLICLEGETPPFSQITGTVTPAYEGITIDLLDTSDVLLYSDLTSVDGSYSFPDLDAGEYHVYLIEPIGFVVNQNHVPVELAAGETETVDFVLTPIVTSNDARSKGYWKHQVNANLSNKGNPDYSTGELLAFSQDIFDHFYMNALNPIQVEGVTFVDNPASALSMEDLQYMLAINQGGSTMYERACQQYLALLLNVVSDKLGQYMQASDDGATVSQAIIYIDELLGDDDELAKDIAETLNQGQTVGAGVIPLTTPNVIFGNDGRAVVMVPREFVMHAYPNPFNPTTTLSFELPVAMNVNLSVFDITGRLVSELVNGFHTEGSYEVVFDGYQSASGIYIYSFKAGEFSETGKLVLVK